MKIRQVSQLTASDMMVAIIGWDVRYAFDRLNEALPGVEEYSKGVASTAASRYNGLY